MVENKKVKAMPASDEVKKSKRGPRLILGVIVIIATVITLFIPIIPVEVTYTEVEPYERLATYEVVSATLTPGWDFERGVYHTFEVTVKNTDKYGGTFTVTFYLYDVNGLYGTETESEYIAAGATKTLKAEFDTKLGQDVRGEYSVSAPTVIDQRIVTKHKTVYKSIIEILIYGTEET